MSNIIKLKDGGEIELELDDGRFEMTVKDGEDETGVVMTREEVGKLIGTFVGLAASDVFAPLADMFRELGERLPKEGGK